MRPSDWPSPPRPPCPAADETPVSPRAELWKGEDTDDCPLYVRYALESLEERLSEKVRRAQDRAQRAADVAEMVQKASLGHEVFERQAILERRVSALDTSVGGFTDEAQQLSRRVDVLAKHFRFSRQWEEEFSGKFLELDLHVREISAQALQPKVSVRKVEDEGSSLKRLDVHKRLAEHLVRLEGLMREQAVQGMETASAVSDLQARMEHLERPSGLQARSWSSKCPSGATSPRGGVGSAVMCSENSEFFRQRSSSSQMSGPMLCDLLSNLELQVVDARSRVDHAATEVSEGDSSSCDRLHLQLERYSARLVAIRHEVSMAGAEAAQMDPALRRVECSLHSLRRRFESFAGRAPANSAACSVACCAGADACGTAGCALGRGLAAPSNVLLSPRPSVETESDGEHSPEGPEHDHHAPARALGDRLSALGAGVAAEAVEALEGQVHSLRAQLGGLEFQLLDLRTRYAGVAECGAVDGLSASCRWLAEPGHTLPELVASPHCTSPWRMMLPSDHSPPLDSKGDEWPPSLEVLLSTRGPSSEVVTLPLA